MQRRLDEALGVLALAVVVGWLGHRVLAADSNDPRTIESFERRFTEDESIDQYDELLVD